MPPAMTKESFEEIPVVAKAIKEHGAHVDFYSAELVGDTSAPCSAFAVVNFPNDSTTADIINAFANQIGMEKLKLPFGGTTTPQVEWAPNTGIICTTAEPKAITAKIDDEPEFITFMKSYESKISVPTDRPIDVEDIGKDLQIPEADVYRSFNIKLLAKQPKNRGQQQQDKQKKNKGKGKKGKGKNKGKQN